MKFVRTAAAATMVMAAALIGTTTPAHGAPVWAPYATATVKPGVQTITAGGQCTANFIFYDAANNIYIGQAAHCSTTGGSTSTNGCTTGSRPLGTAVTVRGASKPGTMVYNSWIAMKAAGETNGSTCAYNDLALVKLDPADFGKVNPSIPMWGGPTGINTTGTSLGTSVYSYGNSGLRLGLATLSPKYGKSIGTQASGWTHNVYTETPGIPGDSGSAFLDATGRALGVLSTIAIAPFAGSNGVGDVSRELAYAQTHGMAGIQLALGTEAFKPLA